MKKIILPLIFFFLILFPTNILADNKDCLKTWNSENYACAGAYRKCYEQCGAASGIAPESCYKACDNTSKACEKEANANFETCKNTSKKNTSKPEITEDQTEPEPGSKITCDQVWKIAGSENCERFVVSNDEGGLWCNLPDTRESLQPWIYGPAPTYSFTPGTCQVESETPELQQPQSDQLEQSNSSADDSKKLQSKPNQDVKPLDVKLFGVNPFQTWLNLRGLAEAGAYIYSGAVIEDIGPIFSPGYAAIQQREAEAKIRSKLSIEFMNQGMERMIKLEGKTGLKNPKEIWDIFPIRAVTEPIIIHQDSATIQVQPLYGEDGVLERNAKSFLELKSGGIDVIVEPKTEEQFQIQTPNAEIVVIGTEFSVLYDPKENQTVVEVYKGEVEVKTNDGKTASVSPNGDKPGAVVVSQKLSVAKLAITGTVVVLLIIGVIWFLKRKFTTKGVTKKKR